MADSFKIVASLDIDKSAKLIKDDIPKLQEYIKNEKIEIVAGLNKSKSQSLIQAQLNTIANQAQAPTIHVGVDLGNSQSAVQGATNGLKTVQEQAKQTASAVKQAFVSMTADDVSDKMVSQFQKSFYIVGKKATETKSQFKSLIAEFNNGWNTGNVDTYSKALEDIYRLATQSTKATKGLDENIKQAAQEIRSTMTDGGKITIGKQLREDLKASLGTAGQIKQVLDTVYGVGNWKYASSSRKSFSGQGTFADEMVGSLKDSQSTLDAILSTYEALDKLPKNMTMFDHMDTETAKSEISKYLQEILKLPSAYQTAQSAETTYTQTAIQDVENLGAIADTLSKKLETIFTGGGQGPQPITDSAHWEKLADQANVASLAIDKIRTADSTTAESIKANAESEIAKLEQLLESYRNIEYSIEEQTKATQELKAVRESITRDANGQQIAKTSVYGSAGYTKTSRYDGNDNLTSYTETENYQNMAKAIAKAQTEAIKLTTRLKEVQSTYSDINGTKSVKNQDNLTQLSNQYAIVEKAIKAVENADSTTMAQMKANAEQEISILRQLATQYHNAEKVATELRTKGFETVKIDTGNNINAFINSINNSKVPIRAMDAEVKKLREDFVALDNIQDQAGQSAGLTKILDTLDNAKTKFQSLKELFKGFGNADWLTINAEQINKIDDMATKIAIYKQHLSSTRDEWKSQGLYIGEVQSKVTSLARSLPNIKKPEKFNEWVQEWNDINQKATQLKSNLDAQVTSQNKIYEIQIQIAKLNPTKDSAEISRLNEKLGLEQKTLSNLQMQSNVFSNLISYEQQEQYITEQTVASREKLTSALNTSAVSYKNEITSAISTLQGLQNKSVFNTNASNPQVAQTKQDIRDLIAEYNTLMSLLKPDISATDLDIVRTKLGELGTKLSQTTTSAKQFETELRNDNGAEKLAQRVALLKAQLTALSQANPKAMKQFGNEINSLMATLNNSPDGRAVDQVTKSVQLLRREINNAGVAGKTFFQNLKEKVAKFTGWMSMTYAISLVTRTIRGMVTDVVELDTALVDLKKTFRGTESDLKNLYISANETAKQLGVTTKDILEQASAWSRLGYSNAEAAETMAKNSAIFKTISPGMDLDMATDGLVSMMKAFDIEANDVLDGIMSKVNIIGNKFATDNSSIVEAMTRSSAAMAAANNTLEETIALNTASIEITRNAETTATAWRTVSMRLRGYDESTEELSDDLKNITGDIADLTKTASNGGKGISLFTDESRQTYKSTYEIIKEIAKIWNELSDKNQAELLEKLAGKRNSQVVAAAIQNFSTAEKAMTEMANSQGNAMAEMEIAYESINYKVNQFKETLVGIAQSSFNQDFLKSMVDSGIRVLNVFDDLSPSLSFILEQFATLLELVTKIADFAGGIPLLIGGIGLKNIGSPKTFGLVLNLPIIICVL